MSDSVERARDEPPVRTRSDSECFCWWESVDPSFFSGGSGFCSGAADDGAGAAGFAEDGRPVGSVGSVGVPISVRTTAAGTARKSSSFAAGRKGWRLVERLPGEGEASILPARERASGPRKDALVNWAR